MSNQITISITIDLSGLTGAMAGGALPINIAVTPTAQGGVVVSPAGQTLPAAARPNVDSTTAAVITAAVTAALAGRPFRIQNIKMAAQAAPAAGGTSWAQAGRQNLHASHAIERKFR